MKTKFIALLISFFLISAATQAQSNWNRRHNQNHQKDRIHDGKRSGELTAREYKHLKREQRKMYRAKKRMMKDGRIDRRERHQLHKMKKHHNRHLWLNKNNAVKRRFR